MADRLYLGKTKVTPAIVKKETVVPAYIPPRDNVKGVYKNPNTATTFSLNGATDVDAYALYYAFYICSSLTSVDFSSLTTLSGNNAMNACLSSCGNLTSVDLSSLTTISGSSAMYNCFYECTGLTSVEFPSLTTISGNNAMCYCFYGCRNLTSVDLSSLTTISGSSAMYNCFYGCRNLTSVDLSSLTTVGSTNAMYGCFYDCRGLTELRFPALQSFGTSTSTVNQFDNMLRYVTGCTLHFPSNMQSEVERRKDYPNFGGTNTVVLFDLPPTA